MRKKNKLKQPEYFGDATSNTTGHILCVAITVLLSLIVLIMVMSFEIPEFRLPEEIPCIFQIQDVNSEFPKYESIIKLKNVGDESYENDMLRCNIYINNEPSGCVIKTMNGHKFINTVHFGVQTISKGGCKDKYWYPKQIIDLDLSNSKIKKGDDVRVDIIWKPENRVISTDEYHVY